MSPENRYYELDVNDSCLHAQLCRLKSGLPPMVCVTPAMPTVCLYAYTHVTYKRQSLDWPARYNYPTSIKVKTFELSLGGLYAILLQACYKLTAASHLQLNVSEGFERASVQSSSSLYIAICCPKQSLSSHFCAGLSLHCLICVVTSMWLAIVQCQCVLWLIEASEISLCSKGQLS